MIIALTGKARSGKDTAAEVLVRTHDFYSTAFAGPLKDACIFKFGLSHDDVHTQEGKDRFVPEWGMTVGEILQKEGTEATKPFWGEDIWIKRWRMELAAHHERGHRRIVVTDCRFDNEAETVRDLGGHVFQIVRPGAEKEIGGRDPNHPSEAGISEHLITHRITNYGTLADLRLIVRNLVGGMLK